MGSTTNPRTTSAAEVNGAADTLFDVLYAELHRLARRALAGQGPAAGLGVTTLLHEAYLTMANRQGAMFSDRARFLAYTARVMRGLIIDQARGRHAEKRGGLVHITTLVTDKVEGVAGTRELARIGDALDELASVDASLAEIVDLKFFCGFSFAEIAAMRGVSERTVQRQWEKARLYLHRALGRPRPTARAAHVQP
jgi:RNA polymerase sigma factor (TIGR02999 family)